MDFKKLTSGAGTLINRAKQYTEEKLGNAEKTEYEENFQAMLDQSVKTKNWIEKILSQTECYLQPNPTVRVEDKMQEKLQGYKATRLMETDTLGQIMIDAGNDLSGGAPAYGSALLKCGEAQKKIGTANREFIQTSVQKFIVPLQAFLDGEVKNMQKELSVLETKRLDLDAVKGKVKRAKPPVAAELEAELTSHQTEFDKQLGVTTKLLEAMQSAHMQIHRSLQDFIETQAQFYSQAHQCMAGLQRQLSTTG